MGDGVGFVQQLRAMQGDKFMDTVPLLLCGRLVEQMLFGNVEHAAGTAGRVIDGGVPFRDGDLQQLDHEANNLTRCEMIPGRFGVRFRESPEQFLIDVAHLKAGELFRSDIEDGILVQDRGEAGILDHFADDGAVIETIENILNVLREAVEVGAKVLFEQGVILLVDLA